MIEPLDVALSQAPEYEDAEAAYNRFANLHNALIELQEASENMGRVEGFSAFEQRVNDVLEWKPKVFKELEKRSNALIMARCKQSKLPF